MNNAQPPGGYGYQRPPQSSPYPYGAPGYYGPPNRPVDHPSAKAALGLGLASVFCLGALAGVPAIVLGRRVLADAAREPGRFRSVFSAQVGVVLGWISVACTSFVVATSIVHGWGSAALGVMFAVLGLTLLGVSGMKGLPKPIAVASGALRRVPLAAGLVLGGTLFGSVVGLSGTIAAAKEAANRCTFARLQYAAASGGEDVTAMRTAIGQIERQCGNEATGRELATMRSDADAKDLAVKARKAEETRVAAEKLAAQKEENAVATFPDRSKAITSMIAAAQAKASQGKVEAADSELDSAQRALHDFKGTSVEQSKGFADLDSRIGEKKKAIQPQIERITEARRKTAAALAEKERREAAAAAEKARKEEARAAVLAAIRGPKPMNSPWDGSVHEVERYLDQVMKDPDSYKHVGSTQVVGEGNYWVVSSRFRGKNSFGAMVINQKKFFIQNGSVVRVADVGGDDD